MLVEQQSESSKWGFKSQNKVWAVTRFGNTPGVNLSLVFKQEVSGLDNAKAIILGGNLRSFPSKIRYKISVSCLLSINAL